MDPRDKGHVGELILHIIEQEIHNDFFTIYAATLALTENIPEQVNNEIRNALNHLARAYLSPDQTLASNNLMKARSHIERAKRDCLKIGIIHERAAIDNLIRLIERRYGLLPRLVIQRREKLITERREILASEIRGEENISRRLEALLDECTKIKEYLQDNFEAGALIFSAGHFLRSLRNQAVGLTLGILGSIIASIIYSYFFPNNHPSSGISSFLHNLVGHL